MRGSLSYLASPYTLYPDGLALAASDAAGICAKLLQSGVHAYSPIVHCHFVAREGFIDFLAEDLFLPHNEAMMQRCDVLIVAQLKSWETSIGIKAEIEYFEKAGKPIFFLDPKTCAMVKREKAA